MGNIVYKISITDNFASYQQKVDALQKALNDLKDYPLTIVINEEDVTSESEKPQSELSDQG